MRLIVRHIIWGSLLSLLTTALVAFAYYENPWCWNLTGDARDVIELISLMFVSLSFAVGIECSRIEAIDDIPSSTLEIAA